MVTIDEIFFDEAILANRFFKKVKSSSLEIFCAKKMTQITGTMLEIFHGDEYLFKDGSNQDLKIE